MPSEKDQSTAVFEEASRWFHSHHRTRRHPPPSPPHSDDDHHHPYPHRRYRPHLHPRVQTEALPLLGIL